MHSISETNYISRYKLRLSTFLQMAHNLRLATMMDQYTFVLRRLAALLPLPPVKPTSARSHPSASFHPQE